MEEIWKPVLGYEGLYEVSNMGNIRSLDRVVKQRNRFNEFSFFKKGKNLIPSCSNGYKSVMLCKDAVRNRKLVHRLVALSFVLNERCLPEVNHEDGDKSNNMYSNLKWVTSSENSIHSYKNGLQKIVVGEETNFSKLKNHQVMEIKKDLSDGILLHREIAEKFNISRVTITNINKGKTWSHIK